MESHDGEKRTRPLSSLSDAELAAYSRRMLAKAREQQTPPGTRKETLRDYLEKAADEEDKTQGRDDQAGQGNEGKQA